MELTRKVEEVHIGYAFNHLGTMYVVTDIVSKYPFGMFAKAVKCYGMSPIKKVYEFKIKG